MHVLIQKSMKRTPLFIKKSEKTCEVQQITYFDGLLEEMETATQDRMEQGNL